MTSTLYQLQTWGGAGFSSGRPLPAVVHDNAQDWPRLQARAGILSVLGYLPVELAPASAGASFPHSHPAMLDPTTPADRDKDVDTSADISTTSAKSLGHSSKPEGAMTDAHFAADLIQETYPIRAGRNVKAAIGDAFEALKRRERGLPATVLRERSRQWTERRVRALWNREARRVDHYEIQDLTAIAVEEARIERQRLKAREDRLAAFLAAHQEGVDRQGRYQAGGRTVGLDLPRDGTDADENADQSQGWGI